MALLDEIIGNEGVPLDIRIDSDSLRKALKENGPTIFLILFGAAFLASLLGNVAANAIKG